jgi:hypothetical protein
VTRIGEPAGQVSSTRCSGSTSRATTPRGFSRVRERRVHAALSKITRASAQRALSVNSDSEGFGERRKGLATFFAQNDRAEIPRWSPYQ